MPRINKVEFAKVICTDCGIEYDKNKYYLSRIEGQERMEVCKGCFQKEFKNDFENCLRKYDIPFIKKMWDISENSCGLYMKNISLPQFSRLRWKDSQFENEVEETNFYDNIVKSLKDDANKLNDKLSKAISMQDMNLYISTIKSLRDTLDLISKYDWKLMYSEYTTCEYDKSNELDKLNCKLAILTDDIHIALACDKDVTDLMLQKNTLQDLIKGKENEITIKQIAVWEQNHENQIRNHKIWNVVSTNVESENSNKIKVTN